MTKLKEIANHPTYADAASASSKVSIFVFIATFAYLLFFSGRSPGFVWGTVFFMVGLFAVPLAITMPLFLLRAKYPRIGAVLSIADVALTIVLTRALFLWLFEVPTGMAVNQPEASQPFVVNCREPLPEFTLGPNSNPSDTAVVRLCACVWSTLDEPTRNTARAVRQARNAQLSGAQTDSFASRFGDAVRACGGMRM